MKTYFTKDRYYIIAVKLATDFNKELHIDWLQLSIQPIQCVNGEINY